MAVDRANKKLFVNALGNNTVEVLDLGAGRVEKHLSGFAEPQGVLLVPESRRLLVTNGESASVQIFDSATLEPEKSIELRDDADNIRYDPATRHAYVGCGKGRNGALVVLDVQAGAKLADIELSGHPESFQLEARGTRIFVNVPTVQAVEVVDRSSGTVVASWPLVARNNYPMALDEAHSRLFVGTRSPAKLLVIDTSSGLVVASLESVGDADDIFYDTGAHRIYVSGGEGFVFVFEQLDADQYRLVGKVQTRPGARTSLYVPEWKTLFVALPESSGLNPEVRSYATAP
jgi:DNA-binding beta-propeller fold protein YncE